MYCRSHIWKESCVTGHDMQMAALGASVRSVSMTTGWRRLIGCRIFIGHFPQKGRIISGSFAQNDIMSGAMQHISEWMLNESCVTGHVDGSAGCIGEYCVNY